MREDGGDTNVTIDRVGLIRIYNSPITIMHQLKNRLTNRVERRVAFPL